MAFEIQAKEIAHCSRTVSVEIDLGDGCTVMLNVGTAMSFSPLDDPEWPEPRTMFPSPLMLSEADLLTVIEASRALFRAYHKQWPR